MKIDFKDEGVKRIIAASIGVAVSLAAVVFALLNLFDVWEGSKYLLPPLLTLNQLSLAYGQWKYNRMISYFCIGTSAVMIICLLALIIVK